LPYLENQGTVSPLKIANGEGIFDAMHFLIRKNKKGKWIIVYEFNFYAPRVTAINLYIRNKLNADVDYVAIAPITGESVNAILKKFKNVKKIKMGIYSGADVSGLSVGLADALKSLQAEQNGTFIEITCSVQRSRNRVLTGNIINNIAPFFKTANPQLSMEHFFVSGIRNDTGEKDEINLMDIILKVKKTVEKMDNDHRFVDSEKMYTALADAYNVHQNVIDRL
jgi:hypothetical protein